MGDADEAEATERALRIRELEGDFRRRMDVIYTTLCSENLQHNMRAPFLRQLLLRLNYNDFMEKTAQRNVSKSVAEGDAKCV